MAFFEHDDCSLHYEEYGLGEPVLLLHGLGSSCQDWEYQIPALASQYRVIVMDMRGHGRSDKPYGRYSIQAMSNDVEALIEHLRLGPVHLIGLSMGGMIGFQLAVDQPHLLKSLRIVNSAPQVKVRSAGDLWQLARRWTLSRIVSMHRQAVVSKAGAGRPAAQDGRALGQERQARLSGQFRCHCRLGRGKQTGAHYLPDADHRSRTRLHTGLAQGGLRQTPAQCAAAGHQRLPACHATRPVRAIQSHAAGIHGQHWSLKTLCSP
ncbi:alpha/beta hydrolase [Pseudomonas meliae]